MELGRRLPTDRWTPPPKGCLRLNVDANFKDGYVALAVLAKDGGRAKGLWFEKKHFVSTMEAGAKALFNACTIAKDQN